MTTLNNTAFATAFVEFLRQTEFPAGLSAADAMFRTNLMVLGIATEVYGRVGRGYTITELASLGPRGGGGGPHLEALLTYLGSVDLRPVASALNGAGLPA